MWRRKVKHAGAKRCKARHIIIAIDNLGYSEHILSGVRKHEGVVQEQCKRRVGSPF
jgi:phage replication-related protein YjqB (UPF0714/DUF867 family)